MMNNSICRLFARIWAFLLLSSAPGHAWGPIAHYLISKETAGEVVAQYANLPDAWESNSYPDYGLTIEVTDYFCWSHAVRSDGVLDLVWDSIPGTDLNPVEIPKKPILHPDETAIEPGHVMRIFLNGKVDLDRRWPPIQNPPQGTDSRPIMAHLQNAASGIASHNDKDHLVHWTYFLGATGNEQTADEAQDAWIIHHGLKEHWAEYIFLATQLLGKHELVRSDFDASGHIQFPSTNPDGSQFMVPRLAIEELHVNNYSNDKINSLAWLLRLAQAAYNKNRTSRSTTDATKYGLDVQSAEDIRKLLKKQDLLLRNYFTQSHWARWEMVENYMPVNFQGGSLIVTLLDGTTETMDYDTPDNLWIEWQLLKNLEKEVYYDQWKRDELHMKAGFTDIPSTN